MGTLSGPIGARGALSMFRLTDGRAISPQTISFYRPAGSTRLSHWESNHRVYSPSATGAFLADADGAPSQPATPPRGGHIAFASFTLNDGRFVVFGGEYWESPGRQIEIFNPLGIDITFPGHVGSWSSTRSVSQPHAAGWMDPDGSIVGDQRYYGLDANTVLFFPSAFGVSTIYAYVEDESASILLPDDRRLSVTANGNNYTFTLFPERNDAGANGTAIRRSWVWNVQARTEVECTFAAGSPAHWGALNGIKYETGSLAWLPHIGEAVLFDGNGHIWHFNPATNQWRAVYRFGFWPFFDNGALRPAIRATTRSRMNLVHPDEQARTCAEILARGTLDVYNTTVTDAFGAQLFCNHVTWNSRVGGAIYLCFGETKAVQIKPTAATDLGNGYTRFTFNTSTGLTAMPFESSIGGAWMRNTIPTGAIGANATAMFGDPQLRCQDDGGVVLPSGQMLQAVGCPGIAAADAFGDHSFLFKYDGVNPPTLISATADTRGLSTGWMLPDGTAMLSSHEQNDGLERPAYRYTPDGSDGTVPDNFRPTLISPPTTILPNTTITLTGRRLTGVSQSSVHTDEFVYAQQFPHLRFTKDGAVFYARTHTFTYRGINPDTVSTFRADIPRELPDGTWTMEVVTHGIPSAPMSVTVQGMPPQVNPSGWTHIPTNLNHFLF